MTKFNYKISYSLRLQLYSISFYWIRSTQQIDYIDYNSPIKSYTLQLYLKGMEKEKKKKVKRMYFFLLVYIYTKCYLYRHPIVYIYTHTHLDFPILLDVHEGKRMSNEIAWVLYMLWHMCLSKILLGGILN